MNLTRRKLAALELFKQRTGTNLMHVPYKGSAPALQDLMAGQPPASASKLETPRRDPGRALA